MPFRTLALNVRTRRWIVPALATVCSLLIGIWVWTAFDAVGGIHKATPGAILIIFGLAGIAGMTVLCALATILLFETVLYENRIFVINELSKLYQTMYPQARNGEGASDADSTVVTSGR